MRGPCIAVALLLSGSARAFVAPNHQASLLAARRQELFEVSSSSPTYQDVQTESFRIQRQDITPVFKVGSGDSEKLVNAFGLWCGVVTALTCPVWSLAMTAVNAINQMNDDFDPNRAIYDKTGKIWAKAWLTMTNSYPTFSGDIQRLKEGQGACLFVANHASWLDIPVLCTVLDPVFKFIAKGELRKVPCIGQQLEGGNHILIDREDRRSQLKTFKDGIKWLKSGVPIMAFPEGKRSKDGRLDEFKGGLFSMAVKTSVPIVPITISHAHAVMPGFSLFPVQPGRGKIHVHIHDPIEANGKSEEELSEMVRKVFLSSLPYDQHPKEKELPATLTEEVVLATEAAMVIEHPQSHDAHHEAKVHVESPFFFADKIQVKQGEKELETVR